jgi:hypothetical protein
MRGLQIPWRRRLLLLAFVSAAGCTGAREVEHAVEEPGCNQPAEAVLTPEGLEALRQEEAEQGGEVGKEPSAEKPIKVRVRLEKLEVKGGGLPRQVVHKSIRRRMSMFRYCYQTIL